MRVVPFEHTMAAHCETGTMAALCNHAGVALSEPMIFGISGGLFFVYLDSPWLAFPTFAVRTQPGRIYRALAKRIGVKMAHHTYRSPERGMAKLDELLSRNIPVAAQVDLFYMSYFPPYSRVHFNGHFITVIGREDSHYLVSDCYYPTVATLGVNELKKARFVNGMLAPKGRLIYVKGLPTKQPDLQKAIISGMRQTIFNMTRLPIGFLGVRGMRTFAKKVMSWPGRARDIDHLSHEIMKIHLILEEQGTGGGGFRFMYATFLQEAAQLLDNSALTTLAKEMMAIGDRWREISLFVARAGRARQLGSDTMRQIADMFLQRADEEERFFKKLKHAIADNMKKVEIADSRME